MRGIVLPDDYFLVRDKEGRYHWYAKDPLRCKNKSKIEVSIEDEISNVVGVGDIANPIMVHVNCAKIDRSVDFNIGLLASVRKGNEERHFEDMEGSNIDVLEVPNSDAHFPLSGVVFDSLGNVVTVRKYSFKGECSDGVEDHHLMAVNGRAVFVQPAKEEVGINGDKEQPVDV